MKVIKGIFILICGAMLLSCSESIQTLKLTDHIWVNTDSFNTELTFTATTFEKIIYFSNGSIMSGSVKGTYDYQEVGGIITFYVSEYYIGYWATLEYQYINNIIIKEGMLTLSENGVSIEYKQK